jgi:hypothetical protein
MHSYAGNHTDLEKQLPVTSHCMVAHAWLRRLFQDSRRPQSRLPALAKRMSHTLRIASETDVYMLLAWWLPGG